MQWTRWIALEHLLNQSEALNQSDSELRQDASTHQQSLHTVVTVCQNVSMNRAPGSSVEGENGLRELLNQQADFDVNMKF